MKNDIDKIDEQIEAIQNAQKRKPKPNGEKVVDIIPSTDTKKIDKIDNIVEEDISINEDGDTKKFDTVDVEENTSKEEDNVLEEEKVEDNPKKKIPTIYIVFGAVIV